MKANSTDIFNSRYTQGGTTERYPTRLGWWDRRDLPRSVTDTTLVLTVRYHQRPWVLAFDRYGDERLEWLILQYNGILDVNEEFVTGKEIILPTLQRVKLEMFGNPVGGKRMTDSR